MLLRRTFLLSAAAALLFSAFAADATSAEKIKVLFIHNGGHDFKSFQAAMTEVLDKTGDFELATAENFDALKIDNLKKFNVVCFYGSGGNLDEETQGKGLDAFVRGGGGMVCVHATDAHKKSEIYWLLNGGRFAGHGGGKFWMRIEDKKHPITAPMEDFEIQDETYRNKFHPDFKLHNLARMDRGNEQQSMVWAHEVDKGRVFNTTLGHGKAAFANEHFQRLVTRGIYWTAGQKPKDPK